MTTTICGHCGLAEHDESDGQVELFEPEHVSNHPERMAGAERIYAEHWMKENVRHLGINEGFGLLEWILCPAVRKRPRPVSQREATVAASVVQWLGTNCGRCMIDQVEKQIHIEKAIRSKFRRPYILVNSDADKARQKESVIMARLVAEKYVRSESAKHDLALDILAVAAGATDEIHPTVPIITMRME